MTSAARGVAAIVGVADEVSPTGVLDSYGRGLHTSVATAALHDAGLSFADVDGVAAVGSLMQASELAEHLGVRPRWLDTTITVDDVLASPYEVAPVHRAEACLVTDGGGAVVVTTAARTADLRNPPIFVLGAGCAQTHSLLIAECPI